MNALLWSESAFDPTLVSAISQDAGQIPFPLVAYRAHMNPWLAHSRLLVGRRTTLPLSSAKVKEGATLRSSLSLLVVDPDARPAPEHYSNFASASRPPILSAKGWANCPTDAAYALA